MIGGGILGLAVANELAERGHQPTVVEKEDGWARHQTGRNSGVIHAGLYYAPGTLKAALCTAGAESMVRFAREHGVPVEVCGKLVVAVTEDELPGLHKLAERAQANGVPAALVDPAGLVLDGATASLDPGNEALVATAPGRLAAGRTPSGVARAWLSWVR